MLYACKCWSLKSSDVARLLRNERAMLHWMCAVKLFDYIRTLELHQRLNIKDLVLVLRRNRLRWFADGSVTSCRGVMDKQDLFSPSSRAQKVRQAA